MLEGRNGDRPLEVAVVGDQPDTTQLLLHSNPFTVTFEQSEGVGWQDISISHIIDKVIKLDKCFVIPSSWVSRGGAENLPPVVAHEIEGPVWH